MPVHEETRRSRFGRSGGWIAGRWRGEAPLGTAFWDDMLIAGSVLNLGTTLLSMTLLAAGAPNAVGAAVFFAPLPVNGFLVVAVWRSAGRSPPLLAAAARGVALVWLVLATAL